MQYARIEPGTFLAQTAKLSPKQFWILSRLILLYQATEKVVPLDLLETARWLQPTKPKRILDDLTFILAEFFVMEEDGYHHLETDRQLQIVQREREKHRMGQAKGVIRRIAKKAKLAGQNGQNGQMVDKLSPNCPRDLNEIKDLQFTEREKRERYSLSSRESTVNFSLANAAQNCQETEKEKNRKRLFSALIDYLEVFPNEEEKNWKWMFKDTFKETSKAVALLAEAIHRGMPLNDYWVGNRYNGSVT